MLLIHNLSPTSKSLPPPTDTAVLPSPLLHLVLHMTLCRRALALAKHMMRHYDLYPRIIMDMSPRRIRMGCMDQLSVL